MSQLPIKKVFISYAHDDEVYTDVLIPRLKKLLQLSKKIKWEVWTDSDIQIGSDWHQSIQNEVQGCDLVILLLSNGFITSQYIRDEEFNVFIERSKDESLTIFPVVIRSGLFHLFDGLSSRQFFVPKGKRYGKATIKDFTFSDLVLFNQQNGGLIPNPNIDRYLNDLFYKIEETVDDSPKEGPSEIGEIVDDSQKEGSSEIEETVDDSQKESSSKIEETVDDSQKEKYKKAFRVFCLIFLATFVLGALHGIQNKRQLSDEHAIKRYIESQVFLIEGEEDFELCFSCPGGKMAYRYNVHSGQIKEEYNIEGINQNMLLFPINKKALTSIFVTSLVATYSRNFFTHITKKANGKFRRLMMYVVAAIPGYGLGYWSFSRGETKCSNKVLVSILEDKHNWQRFERRIIDRILFGANSGEKNDNNMKSSFIDYVDLESLKKLQSLKIDENFSKLNAKFLNNYSFTFNEFRKLRDAAEKYKQYGEIEETNGMLERSTRGKIQRFNQIDTTDMMFMIPINRYLSYVDFRFDSFTSTPYIKTTTSEIQKVNDDFISFFQAEEPISNSKLTFLLLKKFRKVKGERFDNLGEEYYLSTL